MAKLQGAQGAPSPCGERVTMPRIFRWLVGLALSGLVTVAGAAPELDVTAPDAFGWIHLRSAGETGRVQVLQGSPNIVSWSEAALFHDGPFDFADVTAPTNAARFFRLVSRAITAADDGRNQITVPEDPFVVQTFTPSGQPSIDWLKFTILLGDETRVWFQDSNKLPFHYDYARLRLAPFVGMSRDEFDRRTQYRTNQLAVLGAVLVPGGGVANEFGIQFVGQEAFPREDILRWLKLVRAAIRGPEGARALYVPTYEQTGVGEANRTWFAGEGFDVAASDRWLSSDAIYSEGWGVGRLTYVPAAEIAGAYASGRLRPTDILLTDVVPAEVPFVAGIISLRPATPNSHVAILASGYGVPFVWFANEMKRADLVALVGHDVALRTSRGFQNQVKLLDVDGILPVDLRSNLLAFKQPLPLKYAAKQWMGLIATNVTELRPDAVRYVGGKAANYGLLRRKVAANSEPAIALTFDLWEAFLDQALPNGRTLRQDVALQLGGLRYPPDFAGVRAKLAAIQDLFTKTAVFSAGQQAAIIAALTNASFDNSRKIRFRSSTNVEDGEDFTGAGLYDSYSGCLADDLDGDSNGPSACDSTESSERGVFRAIQRVYASFYNENAFLERLRRGVKEEEVGMAVLVHHSFPDEFEMANGVATLRWQKSFGSISVDGQLVSQLGAESVANPDSTARPEVVDFYSGSGFTSVYDREQSGLVPLGGHVMPWETEYLNLVGLLASVANGYAAMVPSKTEFSLDIEYKRIVPGKLDIKQVRLLPLPQPAVPVASFLLPEMSSLCVEEGEYGDVFAKHRLKCELRLGTDARRLTDAGLATTFYRDATFNCLIGTNRVELTNGFVEWSEFAHSREADDVLDRWTVGADVDRRRLRLRSSVIRSIPPPQALWVTQSDFSRVLEADYVRGQPTFGFDGVPTTTTQESVRLVQCPSIGPDSLLQTRVATNKSGVRVEAQFYWPPPPTGPSAGYTAPNIGFVRTTITGLTTQPMILQDRAAQTYAPGHHNFWEEMLFEPRLDPGVSSTQLSELGALKIRQLVVSINFDEVGFWAVNADGQIRKYP